MKQDKHTPIPEFQPYVTAKGGVVILNGPFPLKQAGRIKALCEAAPDMYQLIREIVEDKQVTLSPDHVNRAFKILTNAKARGET